MFRAIFAADIKKGIAKDGKIPWNIPEDLHHFATYTKHCDEGQQAVIIMGRKTLESLPFKLPHRHHVVITKNANYTHPWADVVVHTPYDVVRMAVKNKWNKATVIGGAEIFSWFHSRGLIYELSLTHITHDYGCNTVCHALPNFVNQSYHTLWVNPTNANHVAQFQIHRFDNGEEQNILDAMREIYNDATVIVDRTLVGTQNNFGKFFEFSLDDDRFPLMTTSKKSLRWIFEELMFFLSGSTDSHKLEARGVDVWKPNTTRAELNKLGLTHYREGDMGPTYGFLFRHFGAEYGGCDINYMEHTDSDGFHHKHKGFDQLADCIKQLKTSPASRRIIINLWDPSKLKQMALPPCLYNYQFSVKNGELSCMMTQRSSDVCVAGGWNVATGALLTYILAHICGLRPHKLLWSVGDMHIYLNQLDIVKQQLDRKPHHFPLLLFKKQHTHIEEIAFEDLELLGYQPDTGIRYPFNV